MLICWTVSPKIAARQGGPAASRLNGDHDREPRVLGPGPERRLAQSRMAHEDDLAGVDLGRGLEIVEGPAQAPGPGGDRAPLVSRRGGPGRVDRRADESRS